MLRTYTERWWQVYITNNYFVHVSIKMQTVSFEAFIDKVCYKDFFSDGSHVKMKFVSNILGMFYIFIIIAEAHVRCHSPHMSKMTETISCM